MKNQVPDRLEIFLALALKRFENSTSGIDNSPVFSDDERDSAEQASVETFEIEPDVFGKFPALSKYLPEIEAEKFKRLWKDYQSKTELEKTNWRSQILKKIGNDEQFIDERIHSSHIAEALLKEIPAVQQIVKRVLPPDFDKTGDDLKGKNKSTENAESGTNVALKNAPRTKSALSLEKAVRRAFAEQFVALRDLKTATAFDRLNGAQLARLIRLTGIREVATACVRIEAVEAVAAFLRIFSAEDAQAIAAQLNSLPKISEARLAFAEHLVQTTLESEPQPAAMLDLLGIRLTGVSLCQNDETRVRYTSQKLPLEIAPKLTEIIDEQCCRTAADLQKQISLEIERLAETLLRAKGDGKSRKT